LGNVSKKRIYQFVFKEKIEDKPRSENLRAEQKGKQTMEVEQNPDPTSIA